MKTACVCYETVILFFAVTDSKIRLSCGRALKPRPYKIRHQVSAQSLLCVKSACTASNV